MRDEHDSLALMLLPDAVERQLDARCEFYETLATLDPLKEGALRIGDTLPARAELFGTQRATVAAPLFQVGVQDHRSAERRSQYLRRLVCATRGAGDERFCLHFACARQAIAQKFGLPHTPG